MWQVWKELFDGVCLTTLIITLLSVGAFAFLLVLITLSFTSPETFKKQVTNDQVQPTNKTNFTH